LLRQHWPFTGYKAFLETSQSPVKPNDWMLAQACEL
jgi:hypothetical protein